MKYINRPTGLKKYPLLQGHFLTYLIQLVWFMRTLAQEDPENLRNTFTINNNNLPGPLHSLKGFKCVYTATSQPTMVSLQMEQ